MCINVFGFHQRPGFDRFAFGCLIETHVFAVRPRLCAYQERDDLGWVGGVHAAGGLGGPLEDRADVDAIAL